MSGLEPGLIDRDDLWERLCQHYWDSLQKDRDLILTHIEAVLRMIPNHAPPRS